MSVVATGFFDGVHLGHRRVIDTLLRLALERGEQSVVVTFWPHPRAVLQDDARALRLLSSQDEKLAVLRSLGVDRVEVLPFSGDFASLTARDYMHDVLAARLGATAVVLGYDNRLGSDRLLPDDSAPVARSLGLEAVVVPALEGISSTVIRRMLSEGRVEDAAAALGAPYSLHGVVVSGNRIGRTIGFPTANLKLYEPLKQLPAVGAYLTRVHTVLGDFDGMTNIDPQGKTETNIFGFDASIYGRDLSVDFVRRLRSEKHFASLDELRTQLAADRAACVDFLK